MLFIRDGWVHRRASTGHTIRIEELTEEQRFHSLGLVFSPGRAKALASGYATFASMSVTHSGIMSDWEGGVDPAEKYGAIDMDYNRAIQLVRDRYGIIIKDGKII